VILVHIYIGPALPSTRESPRLNTILRRTGAEVEDLFHAAFSSPSMSLVDLICAARNGRSTTATENLIAARVWAHRFQSHLLQTCSPSKALLTP